MFGRLKDWRRVATRYDRCPKAFSPPSLSQQPSCSGYVARTSPDPVSTPSVALPIDRVILNLCGATIQRLENSGGLVIISKHDCSPGSDVSDQSIKRSDSVRWIVSGSLTPNGICPGCGLHSPRCHGWRRRRLQDYPAHRDRVSVALQVCRWRCLASACPRRTFSDQVASIACPFARRLSERLSIILGMRPFHHTD